VKRLGKTESVDYYEIDALFSQGERSFRDRAENGRQEARILKGKTM